MAKLTGHGAEIGTVFFLTIAKRYFADGTILKHSGFGWKRWGRVKAGITPEQAFEKAKQRLQDIIKADPAGAAYRECLHKLTGISKRWKLHQCVSLLGDDVDGVWSEACDGYGDNVSADVSEIKELCRLWAACPLSKTDALRAAPSPDVASKV
jgi:hypothetical protein